MKVASTRIGFQAGPRPEGGRRIWLRSVGTAEESRCPATIQGVAGGGVLLQSPCGFAEGTFLLMDLNGFDPGAALDRLEVQVRWSIKMPRRGWGVFCTLPEGIGLKQLGLPLPDAAK